MIVLLVVLAFGPQLAWTLLVRLADRHHREPFWAVLFALAVGAVPVVLATLVVTAPIQAAVPASLYAVVGAPVFEEVLKAAALWLFLGTIGRVVVDEPVDPIVYAASIGFGFAATENVTYFAQAVDDPALLALLVVVRSGGTAIMHGTAVALVGLAAGRARAGLPGGAALPALRDAILLHVIWNASAGFGLVGLAVGAVALVVFAVRTARGFRRLLALSPHALASLPGDWSSRLSRLPPPRGPRLG